MAGDKKKYTLQIWISGYRSDIYSLNEIRNALRSKVIVLLSCIPSATIGIAVAVILYLSEYRYAVLVPFYWVFQRYLLVWAALGMMFAWVQFSKSNHVVVPSIIINAVPEAAVFSFIYYASAGNPNVQISALFLISVLIIRMPIQELLYFIAYKFVIPDMVFEHRAVSGCSELRQCTTNVIALASRDISKNNRIIIAGTREINLDEIRMVEAQGNYTKIVTTTGSFLERVPLSSLLEQFPDDVGLTTHRSYWVAYKHIESYDYAACKGTIKIKGGASAKVAIRRASRVREMIERESFCTLEGIGKRHVES